MTWALLVHCPSPATVAARLERQPSRIVSAEPYGGAIRLAVDAESMPDAVVSAALCVRTQLTKLGLAESCRALSIAPQETP